MAAQIPREFFRMAPRVAFMARAVCCVLAVLGALTAVATSFTNNRWDASLLQVSWVLAAASLIAFLVMVCAIWAGSHGAEADAASSSFKDSQQRP